MRKMDSRQTIKDGIVYILKSVTKQDEGWYMCIVSDPINGKIYVNESAYLQVDDSNQKSSRFTLIVILIAIVFVIIIMTLLSILWFRRKPKREIDESKIKLQSVSKESSFGYPKCFQKAIVNARKQTVMMLRSKKKPAKMFKYKFPYDLEWEFPHDKLVLGTMLGKGVFGKVFQATASGLIGDGATAVAVKMLNVEFSDEDVKDLVQELEVMKMVGSHSFAHSNIVNLLGCCSKDGPLYVIVDYAANGNLQSFLRKYSLKMSIVQDKKLKIGQNKQLSFVAQIASGMKYLSSIGCTHQDLKARNVLVCEDYTMKITDYGRDIYYQNRVPKTTSGIFPIQWIAPESLLKYTFDEKSDVWSFGVTFWEVLAFGGDPLVEFTECRRLVEFLKQGNRLKQPLNCPDAAYSIMIACWQFDSASRLTFSEIVNLLKQLGYTTLNDDKSETHDKTQNNQVTYASIHHEGLS